MTRCEIHAWRSSGPREDKPMLLEDIVLTWRRYQGLRYCSEQDCSPASPLRVLLKPCRPCMLDACNDTPPSRQQSVDVTVVKAGSD